MIVDSHLHLFRSGYGRFTRRGFPFPGLSDLEAYEALRSQHEVGAGLVVGYEAEGIDPSNNSYVRDLAADHPWIHSVAFLHPTSKPDAAQIASLFAAGHCGIALYLPDEDAAKALDAWPTEAWQFLSDARAIVSLNARPEATRHIRPLVERARGCQFLFSHLGLPGRYPVQPTRDEAAGRLGDLLDLAGCPNVGVKLSGLYAIDPLPPHRTAQPFVELLFERFRSADLHWGSDFSPALDYVSFDETIELTFLGHLEPAVRKLVLGQSLASKLRSVRSKAAAEWLR